ERTVDLVGVVPVVDAGAHEDHAAALAVDGVLRPLPGQAHDLLLRDAGDLGGPGRRGRCGRVVVAGRPRPRQALAADAVVGEQQVQHGGDQTVADPADRDAAALQDLV